MTREKTQYGNRYWCLKTKLSPDGEIYAWADEARILPDGTLAMIRHARTEPTVAPEQINLALAPGHWSGVFAASVFDGHPVAVEHWGSEVAA